MVCGFRPADRSNGGRDETLSSPQTHTHTKTHSDYSVASLSHTHISHPPTHTHRHTPEKKTNYFGNLWLLSAMIGKPDLRRGSLTAGSRANNSLHRIMKRLTFPVMRSDKRCDTPTFFFLGVCVSLNSLTHRPERTTSRVFYFLSPSLSSPPTSFFFLFFFPLSPLRFHHKWWAHSFSPVWGCWLWCCDFWLRVWGRKEAGWGESTGWLGMQYGPMSLPRIFPNWVGRRLCAYGRALCACILPSETSTSGLLTSFCRLATREGLTTCASRGFSWTWSCNWTNWFTVQGLRAPCVWSARLYSALLLKPYATFGTKHRLCLKKKSNWVHKKWIQKYLNHPTVVGNNNGYETFLFDDIREDMGLSKKTRSTHYFSRWSPLFKIHTGVYGSVRYFNRSGFILTNAAWSLRYIWNLAHPSCRAPIWSIFNWS